MADTKPTTDDTAARKPVGRPATQVTATLVDQAKFDEFTTTRRALGIESPAEAVRAAIDEFIETHADETAKAREFFGW